MVAVINLGLLKGSDYMLVNFLACLLGAIIGRIIDEKIIARLERKD